MNAYLLSLNPEANISHQWDFGFVKDFLEDNEFDIKEVNKLPKDDKAIVVIPARHHAGLESEVNHELKNIGHVVIFCMGDEEAEFEVEKISHPSIHIWVQNAHPGRHDNYNKLGTGYPQHLRDYIKFTNKDLDLYFAGQITHQRREELSRVLDGLEGYEMKVVKTEGFTQGESPKDYFNNMFRAKLAPCPSGAVIPDSFRLFEALECMAIPVADNKTPNGVVLNYWDWLFGGSTPFPQVTDWDVLPGIMPGALDEWPANMHKQTAWYIKYKRDFRNKVLEQLG